MEGILRIKLLFARNARSRYDGRVLCRSTQRDALEKEPTYPSPHGSTLAPKKPPSAEDERAASQSLWLVVVVRTSKAEHIIFSCIPEHDLCEMKLLSVQQQQQVPFSVVIGHTMQSTDADCGFAGSDSFA